MGAEILRFRGFVFFRAKSAKSPAQCKSDHAQYF